MDAKFSPSEKVPTSEFPRGIPSSLQMSFEYDNINTFMAGQMTVGVDDTMTDYIQKLEKTKATRQLESRNKRRRKTPEPS